MKIKDLCFILVLAVLILALPSFILCPASDPIRYENFDNIQIGMTRSEVAELLGCGPCTHVDGVTYITLCNYKGPDPGGTWEGKRKKISITFVNDRVEQKSIQEKPMVSDDWLSRVARCLGFGGVSETAVVGVQGPT